MTRNNFDALVAVDIKEVVDLLRGKGKEYALEEDRFSNFNEVARASKIDRKKVWQAYFYKHSLATDTYIQTGRSFSGESVHGRIMDMIAYLLLLDGMIWEELYTPAYPEVGNGVHEYSKELQPEPMDTPKTEPVQMELDPEVTRVIKVAIARSNHHVFVSRFGMLVCDVCYKSKSDPVHDYSPEEEQGD